MVFMTELELRSGQTPAVEITQAVAQAVGQSGVSTGIVAVETLCPASGVLRAAAGSGKVVEDIMKEIRLLVPARITFANEESPENAAGWIKGALFGTGVSCTVKDGAVEGGIYFMDYDGPRTCTYRVCVVGE